MDNAWRRKVANIPLPSGAIEDSAEDWKLEDGRPTRWFCYWVQIGSCCEVRIWGIQEADGSVSQRGISRSDFTAGDADAAREFNAAMAAAADELQAIPLVCLAMNIYCLDH